MRISDSIIEQLNSQADLVEIIGKHTVLKPSGREFKGCCPFHGEKTPSFYVNPQTNLYYCFGCGAKGNPITFLKDYEKMSFIEAAKFLAAQTRIELPKDDSYDKKVKYQKTTAAKPHATKAKDLAKPTKEQTNPQASDKNTAQLAAAYPDGHDGYDESFFGGQPADDDFSALPELGDTHNAFSELSIDALNQFDNTPIDDGQGDLYALLESINQYYQYMLANTPIAKQYFLERGLTEETIHTFGLGYAPADWQHLESVFASDIEGLKILGLVRESSKGNGRTFDLLRHRVIFPIRDKGGRVVGFAGRSLGDEMPKYINSSESPVFQKQHILYGLYEARKARATDYLMVEGYMDVIALYQAGIYGAVAPMGTVANQNQVAQLLKYNDTLTLCFDGDSAGQRAAWRLLEVAAPVLSDGKNLKFLTLPNNHDPDTFITAFGAEAMREQISLAVSLSEYIYQVLMTRYDLTKPEQKATAMAELRRVTALMPKGASLKWWINSDIYQRLKNIGATSAFGQRRALIDTIDYGRADDVLDEAFIQLCLCLLFYPEFIINDDPLASIVSASGMALAHQAYEQHLARQNLSIPDLPNWKNLGSPLLTEVADAVIAVASFLLANKESEKPPAEQRSPTEIQHAAHSILAALSDKSRHILSARWQSFFEEQQSHRIQDISLFCSEMLCIVMKAMLQRQQENSKNLVLSEIYKRRLQALMAWDSHNKVAIANMLNK